MAYMNPILGAIQNKQNQEIANQQFEANYAMKAQQLGAQMPGWKASADAQVLKNENSQYQQLGAQYRETVMDRETGKFPTAQQLMADPAWNQRVVDFYNAPLIRKVWDNDGTGKSFKGFVPLNDTQAVVELNDPSKPPGEQTFVTENGTSDPDDNPMLFDEEGYNRFNGTILSRMTNATGQLGSAGLEALVDQANASRDQAGKLINDSAIGGFSRLDLNTAAGIPQAPQAQTGATEIPIDQSPVEVPNAFGTEGGLSFNIGERDPSKRRGPQPKNVVLRKALENTDTASSLSQYTPDELNKIPDTMLQSAAKFHEAAIKDNSQQRVIKKGGRGKGEKQPLTEDQQDAIAQHTAALGQIKDLAASRVAVGNATDQNTMASKATNNAVNNESVTPSMLADPAKVTALDASIKAKVGEKPEDIGKAVAKAGEKIGSIKPNKPFTYKDAYQLDLLKTFKVIDQATFNRVLELGVFSKDTIDLVNNNVTAHAKLVQEQMGNDAAARAAAILAKAKLKEDKGNGDFLDVQQSLDTVFDENPEGYFTALFSSHSVDQLSVPQAAHLSVQMGQKLNEKFDISWYSDPIDFFTQGNAKKEDAAVGMRNYALTEDGRVVNIDPTTGQERGDADVRLSSFSADEQTYLRKELKSPYDTRSRNVEREYLLIKKKVRDGLVSAQQMPAVQARLEILEGIATALDAQKGGG
jgi:hypothetical protein